MTNTKVDVRESPSRRVETRGERNPDDPFLPPMADPQDPAMKQVHAWYASSLGKVISPVKVHSARLPPDFVQFYAKVPQLDNELQLSADMALMIRENVARINVCLFCIDSNRAATIKESMNQANFDALGDYAKSPLFTEAERAALDYVNELTRSKKVEPETFQRLAQYYSERQICEIVWLVASEHLYNITNIGLNIHSDMLCNIALKNE